MVPTDNNLKSQVLTNITEYFCNPKWLSELAILAQRNDSVDKTNLELLHLSRDIEQSFRSIDTIVDAYQAVQFQRKFLDSL